MEKLIDKFGLYDLFSILIPGMITVGAANYICTLYFDGPLYDQNFYVLFYLLGGYFCGILLHEIVGIIESHQKYYAAGYYAKADSNIFDSYEMEIIEQIQKKIVGTDSSERAMAHVQSVCVNGLQINGKNFRADNLKTASEMAHALCIVMSVTCISVFFLNLCLPAKEAETYLLPKPEITMIVCFVSAYIFHHRAKRMHRYYLRCLFRTYALLHNLTVKDIEQE